MIENKTIIEHNYNVVPHNINNATQVIGEELKAISAFLDGLIVIFSLGNDSTNVLLLY